MGSTQVEICNMALDDVSGSHVIALTGKSKAATTLKGKWQMVVDAVLQDHNWSFALRWVALTLAGTKGDGKNGPLAVYQYSYLKPVGYISGVRLEDPEAEWEEVGDYIHTDVAGAIFQYVKTQQDASRFPPLFVSALAKRLASEICVPLNQDKNKAGQLFDVYRLYLEQAKLANARTQIQAKDESPDNCFTAARD